MNVIGHAPRQRQAVNQLCRTACRWVRQQQICEIFRLLMVVDDDHKRVRLRRSPRHSRPKIPRARGRVVIQAKHNIRLNQRRLASFRVCVVEAHIVLARQPRQEIRVAIRHDNLRRDVQARQKVLQRQGGANGVSVRRAMRCDDHLLGLLNPSLQLRHRFLLEHIFHG